MFIRRIRIVAFILLAFMGWHIAHAQDGQSLLPMRVMAGNCRTFSADARFIATTQGVFEVATGERLFALDTPARTVFDSTGAYLAVPGDGVYSVPSGEHILSFSNPQAAFAAFSPASTVVAVDNDGVYDLATGERRFRITRGNPLFVQLDTQQYIATDFFLYELATGTEHPRVGTLPFRPDLPRFQIDDEVYGIMPDGSGFTIPALLSPDGAAIAVRFDGVYDAQTGEKWFTLPDVATTQQFYDLRFSVDSRYLRLGDDTIYALPNGEIGKLVNMDDFFPADTGISFSPDARLQIRRNEGVADVARDELLFKIAADEIVPSVFFSADGSLIAVVHPAISPSACVLWAWDDHPYVAQTGTLIARYETDVRLTPDEGGRRLAYTLRLGEYRVVARNPDSSAYKVAGVGLVRGSSTEENIVAGWVSAKFVLDVVVPDALPVLSE
jgi:hypothetical protein